MTRRRSAASVAAPVRASSAQDWRTPRWLVERTRVLMGGPPACDPATGPSNPLGAVVSYCGVNPSPTLRPGPLFGAEEPELTGVDGLAAPWPDPWWLNPPFAQMGPWLARATERLAAGDRGVVLLPCNRLETDAYHALFRVAPLRAYLQEPGTEHRSNRRVAFERPDGSTAGGGPYATMLVGAGWSPAAWVEAFGGPWGYCEQARPL